MDGVKGVQLENQIRAKVTENVIMHCPQCSDDLSESFIQPGILKCSETAARLIYRSTIETNGSHNASELVEIINGWVTSTDPGQATFNLWPFVMYLDSCCPVSITSLDSPLLLPVKLKFQESRITLSHLYLISATHDIEAC